MIAQDDTRRSIRRQHIESKRMSLPQVLRGRSLFRLTW